MSTTITQQADNSSELLKQASVIIKSENNKVDLVIADLVIKQEKRVALLGLNGAGKSTFIRNLIGEKSNLGFDTLYQTNQPVENNHSFALKPNDQKFKELMGYQADTMLSMGQLSVYDYLNLCAGFKKLSASETSENIERIISNWSLESILKQSLSCLSKGNMQKVAIAQAFVNQPKFLFFDEPCQSLDPIEQEGFNKNIKELTNFSLCIFSTHNINHALSVADDILIIHQSKVVYFYQDKLNIDYLCFSFEGEKKLIELFDHFSIEHKALGNGLYKIVNSDRINEFVKTNKTNFEFCLPEKEALMPLFRLLASNEWQPSAQCWS